MLKKLLLALFIVGSPSIASADLDFYINDTAPANVGRYEVGDLVDIIPSSLYVPALPFTGPWRIVRVQTTKTKADVMAYLEPGPSGRRRYYALDTTKMTVDDYLYWETNRFIIATEATALGWITRKK